MKRLFLHIGQSKTGTSFIQRCLRLQSPELARFDISYPERRDESPEHADSRISSGNGRDLLSTPREFSRSIERCAHSLLFSSEFLFEELIGMDDPSWIPEIASDHGFESVEVLMFVRNPLGHAASVWQQGVKRGGLSGPIDDIFATFDAPERALRVLRRLRAADFAMTVSNYSRVDSVVAVVEHWLGVPPGVLATEEPSVNRSLTFAETELQLALNRALGESASIVADLLIERLPDLEPYERRPSLAVQEEAWARMLPAITDFASEVPVEAHYECDIRADLPNGDGRFDAEQLDIVAEAVALMIESARRSGAESALARTHAAEEALRQAGSPEQSRSTVGRRLSVLRRALLRPPRREV